MSNINWFAMFALSVTALLFVGLTYLRRKKINFSLIILIGLGLGILAGIIFKGNLEFVEPIGKIYIRIITAIVAPLIIFSILSSITSLKSINALKKIGLRSIFWLMLNTLIAIILTIVISLLLGIGKDFSLVIDNINASELNNRLVPFTQVVTHFFPSTIISDLQNNSIIPLILFSLLLAVAYLKISGKHEDRVKPFKKFADATKSIIYKAVDFIVELTPFAVLSLVASAVSKAANAKDSIKPMLILLIVSFVLCAIHTYLINGALVYTVAKLNPIRFFKKISDAQLTAFTTQSSVGTLPVTINNLVKKIGVSDNVANFVAPLGTTIGMPSCGGIWPVLLAIFAINALGIDYSFVQYITLVILALLVSLGTAGVPGTATITATAVFTAAGLPVEVIIVLLPITTIADMARTATNVTAAAVSAAIVARKESQIDLEIFIDKKAYEDAWDSEDEKESDIVTNEQEEVLSCSI